MKWISMILIWTLAQRHSKIGRRHPSRKTSISQFVPLRFSGIRLINIYFKYYGEKLIVETFGGVDLGVDFLIVISDGGVNPALALLKVDIVSRDLCTWIGVPIFLTIFLPFFKFSESGMKCLHKFPILGNSSLCYHGHCLGDSSESSAWETPVHKWCRERSWWCRWYKKTK